MHNLFIYSFALRSLRLCGDVNPSYFFQSEIHDQPDAGDDHKVVVLPLVPEQLKVGCQVEPLVDREVVVELDAPRIPEVD